MREKESEGDEKGRKRIRRDGKGQEIRSNKLVNREKTEKQGKE